jgi:DNA repair protein RadC
MKKYKSTIDRVRLAREKTDFVKAKIKSSSDAAVYIRQFYHEDMTIYESAFILLLNRSNNTIGYAKISQIGRAHV